MPQFRFRVVEPTCVAIQVSSISRRSPHDNAQEAGTWIPKACRRFLADSFCSQPGHLNWAWGASPVPCPESAHWPSVTKLRLGTESLSILVEVPFSHIEAADTEADGADLVHSQVQLATGCQLREAQLLLCIDSDGMHVGGAVFSMLSSLLLSVLLWPLSSQSAPSYRHVQTFGSQFSPMLQAMQRRRFSWM